MTQQFKSQYKEEGLNDSNFDYLQNEKIQFAETKNLQYLNVNFYGQTYQISDKTEQFQNIENKKYIQSNEKIVDISYDQKFKECNDSQQTYTSRIINFEQKENSDSYENPFQQDFANQDCDKKIIIEQNVNIQQQQLILNLGSSYPYFENFEQNQQNQYTKDYSINDEYQQYNSNIQNSEFSNQDERYLFEDRQLEIENLKIQDNQQEEIQQQHQHIQEYQNDCFPFQENEKCSQFQNDQTESLKNLCNIQVNQQNQCYSQQNQLFQDIKNSHDHDQLFEQIQNNYIESPDFFSNLNQEEKNYNQEEANQITSGLKLNATQQKQQKLYFLDPYENNNNKIQIEQQNEEVFIIEKANNCYEGQNTYHSKSQIFSTVSNQDISLYTPKIQKDYNRDYLVSTDNKYLKNPQKEFFKSTQYFYEQNSNLNYNVNGFEYQQEKTHPNYEHNPSDYISFCPRNSFENLQNQQQSFSINNSYEFNNVLDQNQFNHYEQKHYNQLTFQDQIDQKILKIPQTKQSLENQKQKQIKIKTGHEYLKKQKYQQPNRDNNFLNNKIGFNTRNQACYIMNDSNQDNIKNNQFGKPQDQFQITVTAISSTTLIINPSNTHTINSDQQNKEVEKSNNFVINDKTQVLPLEDSLNKDATKWQNQGINMQDQTQINHLEIQKSSSLESEISFLKFFHQNNYTQQDFNHSSFQRNSFNDCQQNDEEFNDQIKVIQNAELPINHNYDYLNEYDDNNKLQTQDLQTLEQEQLPFEISSEIDNHKKIRNQFYFQKSNLEQTQIFYKVKKEFSIEKKFKTF
ncbi:hypothetical protein ABPG74_011173 [Tetrahymena malaccensis]